MSPCAYLPNTLASESLLNPRLNCTFKHTSGLTQAAVHEQHTESPPPGVLAPFIKMALTTRISAFLTQKCVPRAPPPSPSTKAGGQLWWEEGKEVEGRNCPAWLKYLRGGCLANQNVLSPQRQPGRGAEKTDPVSFHD